MPELGENLRAMVGDADDGLQSDAPAVLEVHTWLEGDHHPCLERQRVGGNDARVFNDVTSELDSSLARRDGNDEAGIDSLSLTGRPVSGKNVCKPSPHPALRAARLPLNTESGRPRGDVFSVVGQFDVEAALRRHLVRQVTDKLAATASD